MELLAYLADLSLGLSDRVAGWGVRNRPMHPEVAQLVLEQLRPGFRELEALIAQLSTTAADMAQLPGGLSDPEIAKILTESPEVEGDA